MTRGREELLTRDRAIEALTRLGDELAAAGLIGDVYLVGGAAMVLAYHADLMTHDIDAVFAPAADIYRAAQIVGDELGLPLGWLNDAAKCFVPGADPGAIKVLDLPSVRVTAASPEFLLGMKVLAARPEQDREDIFHLARLLNLKTSGDVLAVVERLYPPGLLLPRTRFLVEEMFPEERDSSSVDELAPQPTSMKLSPKGKSQEPRPRVRAKR